MLNIAIQYIRQFKGKTLDELFDIITKENNIIVIYTDKIEDNEEIIGAVNYKTNTIRIKTGQTIKDTLVTKYHELAHFIISKNNLCDNSKYISINDNFDEYYEQEEEKLCRGFYMQMQIAETFY